VGLVEAVVDEVAHVPPGRGVAALLRVRPVGGFAGQVGAIHRQALPRVHVPPVLQLHHHLRWKLLRKRHAAVQWFPG